MISGSLTEHYEGTLRFPMSSAFMGLSRSRTFLVGATAPVHTTAKRLMTGVLPIQFSRSFLGLPSPSAHTTLRFNPNQSRGRECT